MISPLPDRGVVRPTFPTSHDITLQAPHPQPSNQKREARYA